MQNETFLLLFSGAAGAAVIKMLDGIIQFFLQRRAKRQDTGEKEKTDIEKRMDAIAGCLMASMLDRIQYLCKDYIKDGSVDIDDLRRLHIMHEKYHDIGGNGDLDVLMKQVNELPIKP